MKIKIKQNTHVRNVCVRYFGNSRACEKKHAFFVDEINHVR